MNPKIELSNIGKKYNREWIFKGVSKTINFSENLAIIGSNGSGKSTLLQLMATNLMPSEGTVLLTADNKEIPAEDTYRYISIMGPGIQIIEDFTLLEHLAFHQKLKPFLNQYQPKDIVGILMLEKSRDKAIKNFSSGMKQRLKLALAILSDVPFVLLDEPTNNLDAAGIAWYKNLIGNHLNNRLFVVASNNIPEEYFFCKETLDIAKYKTL